MIILVKLNKGRQGGLPELLWILSQARPVSQAAEPGLPQKGRGWPDHPGLAWPCGQSVNPGALAAQSQAVLLIRLFGSPGFLLFAEDVNPAP